MAIQLRQESPANNVNDNLEERELQVRTAYYERIKLLFDGFMKEGDKSWSDESEFQREFSKYLDEAAFQIEGVGKSLFDPRLSSKISSQDIAEIKLQFFIVAKQALIYYPASFKWHLDNEKLDNIISKVFEDYIKGSNKNNRGFVSPINAKGSIDKVASAGLLGLKKHMKDGLSGLGSPKVHFDKLKKIKGIALGLPVLAGAAMSTMMTGSLIKFGFVDRQMAGWHNIPDNFQTAISYGVGAALGIYVANKWVGVGKSSEQIAYLKNKGHSTKKEKSDRMKLILVATTLSTGLMGLDYAGIRVRGAQGYGVKNQIEKVSDSVDQVMRFDPKTVDYSSPLPLQEAYSKYVYNARSVKGGIQANVDLEKRTGDGPATRAHLYPIEGKNVIAQINGAPGNNQQIKADLVSNVNSFDTQTRSTLGGEFSRNSGLLPGMQQTLNSMVNNINGYTQQIHYVKGDYLRTIYEYENSSGLGNLFREVFLGATIDMDVRDVKNYQQTVVNYIFSLQYQLNQMNQDTIEAVKAYNDYTQSVDAIASKYYKRSPLPLSSVNIPPVDLSRIVEQAKKVPAAQANSLYEYMSNMEQIVGNKDVSDSIKHGAGVRLIINMLLLAYPVFLTMWVPAFRRYFAEKNGGKTQDKLTGQEKKFQELMDNNIRLLRDSLSPLEHIFPSYKVPSDKELEALLVSFLRDEYKIARTEPSHGKNIFEKAKLRGSRFIKDFFFHDTRVTQEIEQDAINRGLVQLSSSKDDKKKVPSMTSQSPAIKKTRLGDEVIDRLLRKILPENMLDGTAADLSEMLNDIFHKQGIFREIVEARMAEIDIRDRDILEARFFTIKSDFEKLSEEIDSINKVDDSEKSDMSFFSERFKFLRSSINKIENTQDFTTLQIDDIEKEYNNFYDDWANFKNSEEFIRLNSKLMKA